jgi:hypothetical protein
MREQEKPFILFRRNRFIYNITPRNASGWMQMGVWMALFVPLVAGFAAYDSTRAADSAFGLADAVFLLVVLVWATGGIMWMKARAEVIDVDQVIRQKREAERDASNRGRRGR